MALQVQDRVKETVSAPGTSAFTLLGAMTGFRAFSSVCANGDTFSYAAQSVDANGNPNGGGWETGLGTYASSTNSITRTTIYTSTNSGAAVNFTGNVQVWIDVPASLFPLGAIQLGLSYLHIQEQQASGTSAGASTSGTNTRTLNTTISNTITGASVASNQITLPAGTYLIFGSAPSYESGAHQAYLYNVTSSATVLKGTTEDGSTSTTAMTHSNILGAFTLASSAALSIRHYMASAKSTSGLGLASSSGQGEVYTNVVIVKIL